MMLLFCFVFSIAFVVAKYNNQINIKSSNNIYMYDGENKSFYEGNNGTKKWISIKNISKDLINATIYSEDKNFYEHTGFDLSLIHI